MQNTALGCSVYQYSHLSVWNLLKTQSFASRTSLWAKSHHYGRVIQPPWFSKEQKMRGIFLRWTKTSTLTFDFQEVRLMPRQWASPEHFSGGSSSPEQPQLRPKNNMRNSVRTRGTVSCSLLLLYIWWEQPNIYLPTAPLLQFIRYELIFTTS